MIQGKRFGLSEAQKADMWRRWKAGQSLHEIGRAFGKEHLSRDRFWFVDTGDCQRPGPSGVDREPGSRTSWWPFCLSSQPSGF